MSHAYYNEHDPFAAAWLRNLIAAGHLPAGDVDERDIRDVLPSDLDGYAQCHFFAGIGGWPYALRLAGWPDDRPVWTGSCPCPPFSAAGPGQRCPECSSARNLCHPRKTGHFVCLDCGCDRHADERHLWPEFGRLIRDAGAPIVFGEQVASADGRLWLAAVRADLESMGRAVGAADLCAAGVGAPHIRQRLWFVADSAINGREQGRRVVEERAGFGDDGGHVLMADRLGPRLEGRDARSLGNECEAAERGGAAGELGDTERERFRDAGRGPDAGAAGGVPYPYREWERLWDEPRAAGGDPWADIEWLLCRDGKARPTQPGLFPLAHGATGRVGKLRAAGNAIVPQLAAVFIESCGMIPAGTYSEGRS